MKVNKKKKDISGYIFQVVMMIWPICMFLVFYVYSNALSLSLSFFELNLEGDFVKFIGFENYKEFFKMAIGEGQLLAVAIKNSLKYWILCFVISNPLYIIFSYVIFKGFRGRSLVRFIIMLPSIISGMIFMLVVKNFVNIVIPYLFHTTESVLYGEHAFTFLLVYDIWMSFTTTLLVYPNTMGKISPEIYDSAKIDGVNTSWQELWYIILPGIYPTLTTFTVTGICGILNGSPGLTAWYMYGAPESVYSFGYYYTVKVMTTTNQQGYPVLAAGGMVMTVILVPLVMTVKRFMEKYGPSED